MQVSRIINTIQDLENNQSNTRCANTGSHTCLTTLIIEIRPNSTPLLLAHTCSQLLTSTSWSNLCWISRLIVVDCTQSQQRLHAQEVTNTFVLPSWVEAWCKCDLFVTAYMVHYPSSGVLVLAHSQIETEGPLLARAVPNMRELRPLNRELYLFSPRRLPHPAWAGLFSTAWSEQPRIWGRMSYPREKDKCCPGLNSPTSGAVSSPDLKKPKNPRQQAAHSIVWSQLGAFWFHTWCIFSRTTGVIGKRVRFDCPACSFLAPRNANPSWGMLPSCGSPPPPTWDLEVAHCRKIWLDCLMFQTFINCKRNKIHKVVFCHRQWGGTPSVGRMLSTSSFLMHTHAVWRGPDPPEAISEQLGPTRWGPVWLFSY